MEGDPMKRYALVLLILLMVTACGQGEPTPTPVPPAPTTVTVVPTRTLVPPTATPVLPTATATEAPTFTPIPATPCQSPVHRLSRASAAIPGGGPMAEIATRLPAVFSSPMTEGFSS